MRQGKLSGRVAESGSAGQLVQGVVSEVLELISLPYLDKSKGNRTDLEEYSHILSLETGLRVVHYRSKEETFQKRYFKSNTLLQEEMPKHMLSLR